jgi:hypothetical protein
MASGWRPTPTPSTRKRPTEQTRGTTGQGNRRTLATGSSAEPRAARAPRAYPDRTMMRGLRPSLSMGRTAQPAPPSPRTLRSRFCGEGDSTADAGEACGHATSRLELRPRAQMGRGRVPAQSSRPRRGAARSSAGGRYAGHPPTLKSREGRVAPTRAWRAGASVVSVTGCADYSRRGMPDRGYPEAFRLS